VGLTIDPAPGRTYEQLQRDGRTGFSWALLGVVSALLLTFAILPLVVSVPFIAVYMAHGSDSTTALDKLDPDIVTPSFLAYLNLSLATAIPAALFVSWLVHGLRPGWVVSVVRRFRWKWLLTCVGIAALVLIVSVLVGSLVPQDPGSPALSSHLNPWTSETRDFLLVILFLTPLQAAGEEFLFRGYLTQAVGGLFHRRWVAVVVPALLFMLAHSAGTNISGTEFLGQPYPAMIDRLAFGLVAGTLAVVTGGLEAGIAMHVLNNFVAFGSALAFGDMTAALHVDTASWWDLVGTAIQSFGFLGLVLWAAKRQRVPTQTPPGLARRTDFRSSQATL
jgi:uncharacterized protein